MSSTVFWGSKGRADLSMFGDWTAEWMAHGICPRYVTLVISKDGVKIRGLKFRRDRLRLTQ